MNAADSTMPNESDQVISALSSSWSRSGLRQSHDALAQFLDSVATTEPIRRASAAAAQALRIEPGHRVLDCGCGTGVFFPWIADALRGEGRIVGVDHSAEILADAAASARTLAIDHLVTLIEADAHRLPDPDGSFDSAHTERMLIHVERPEIVVRELARVVKPGGWVVCVEPDLAGMRIHAAGADRTGALVDGFCAGIAHPAVGLELGALMHESGLEEIEITPIAATERSCPPDDLERLKLAAVVAVNRGLMTQAESESTLAAIATATERGAYLSYGVMFVVAGCVPVLGGDRRA